MKNKNILCCFNLSDNVFYGSHAKSACQLHFLQFLLHLEREGHHCILLKEHESQSCHTTELWFCKHLGQTQKEGQSPLPRSDLLRNHPTLVKMLGINPRGRKASSMQQISTAPRLEVPYLTLSPDDQSILSAHCMLKHRHGFPLLIAPTAAPSRHRSCQTLLMHAFTFACRAQSPLTQMKLQTAHLHMCLTSVGSGPQKESCSSYQNTPCSATIKHRHFRAVC